MTDVAVDQTQNSADADEAFVSPEPETTDTADATGDKTSDDSTQDQAGDGQGTEAFAGEDDAKTTDADDDAGSEQEGKSQAPEEYEAFDLPDGWKLEGERLETFTAMAKEAGLSQAQAQTQISMFIKQTAADQAEHTKTWQDAAATWTSASKAAGLLTDDSLSLARTGIKAVDADGSLGRTLKALGLDKHPGLIAVFKAHGKAVSPPSEVPGAGSGTGGPRDHAATLYPNQK